MKLSHHSYRSSLIGLLSTSVLLSLSVGSVLADADTNQPTTHLTAAQDHDRVTTKKVTRTINYTDPLTKEKHTIKQVVRFKFDHNGKLVKGTMPAWPAYFVPYFEEYTPNVHEIQPKVITPNSADEVENVTYEKLLSKDYVGMASIEFIPVDGTALPSGSRFQFISDPDEQSLSTVKLPTPPEGWEYVNRDQLPQVLRVYSNTGSRFKFLVQRSNPAGHQEKKQESQELNRKIILHLPTGDRTITQHAHAIRDVVVTAGKTNYGEWQISPFEELKLPQVDGYQSSLDKVASLQLTADQLGQEPTAVEVDYHKIAEKVPSKDVSTATPSTDKESQTTSSVTKEDGSQASQLTTTDTGTQTTQSARTDEGSQTVNVPTADTGVGDATIKGVDQGTQTEQPATSSVGTQTDQPATTDAGTQTVNTPDADAGVGDDTVKGVAQGSQTAQQVTSATETQTAPLVGKDAGTQTDQPVTADEGSQTINVPTTSTGVGDGTVKGVDQGTQTAQSTANDAGTQTEAVTSSTENTQTKSNQTSEHTQTEPSVAQDAGTQTEATVTDGSLQTGVKKGSQGITGTHEQASGPHTSTDEVAYIGSASNGLTVKTPTTVASQEKAAVDPVAFHTELDQLQRPLKELTAVPQHHQAASLPQAGNRMSIKAIVSGILAMITGATAFLLHLRKRGR